MKELEGAVAQIAAKQHSLITLTQLDRLGVTRSARRARLNRGQWRMVERTVVGINGVPLTWESKLLAVVLDAGRGAVASHRSAAALWELDGCRQGMPEITIPRGRKYRHDGIRVHHSTDLDRTAPTSRNNVPTTSVERTLLDLGAVLSLKRVHVALDHARRTGKTDWDGLLHTLVAHARRGRDGVGTLRAILDEHFGEVAATDSGFERLVIIALAEAGVPKPVLQHEVHIAGCRYRIDLAYPELRIAIELDGSQHREREKWEQDHARQNALVNAGWRVLRFTWRDYTEHVDRMIFDIKRALRNAQR